MKKYFLATLLLALLPVSSSKVSAIAWSDPDIVSTTPRSVVSIHMIFHKGAKPSQINTYCSGTLIAPQWVLTASHCIADYAAWKYTVVTGLGTKSQTEYKVSKYYVPSQVDLRDTYDAAFDGYDIALLKLSSPVKYAKPATVRKFKSVLAFTGSLTVYGFGLDQNDEFPGVVGARKVKFVQDFSEYPAYVNPKNSRSLGAYSSREVIGTRCEEHSTTLSAPPTNSEANQDDEYTSIGASQVTCRSINSTVIDGGACSGDSGGPILGNLNGTNYVLAVVSYGSHCADPFPTIYMKVNSFVSWIKATMANN